ncbi:MAG: hypothetical protein HBSIN02_02860 [Bacteroidia bacterium]|nr:MAG: hypothetical protein HBSIN02_02860 [Bacteroidia bacterium]
MGDSKKAIREDGFLVLARLFRIRIYRIYRIFKNEEINLMLRILKFLSGTRRVDAPARFLIQITERRNARIVFSISLSV